MPLALLLALLVLLFREDLGWFGLRVLNLAEGSAKPTAKDRKKLYAISMGSLREVQAILDICEQSKQLKQSDSVAACLYKLMQNPGGSN